MTGQDSPDSGISHLVNKGGGVWFFKLVFLGKKNNQKMLRHSGRPLGAQACHLPASKYIQDAEGVPPAPKQVQSLAMHVCKRSPPRPPWDTLVQNALPGPPGAQGELGIHSHLINIIEVLPIALAFLTQNRTDGNHKHEGTEAEDIVLARAVLRHSVRPPSNGQGRSPYAGPGWGPCPSWSGGMRRALLPPTKTGGFVPKVPKDGQIKVQIWVGEADEGIFQRGRAQPCPNPAILSTVLWSSPSTRRVWSKSLKGWLQPT